MPAMTDATAAGIVGVYNGCGYSAAENNYQTRCRNTASPSGLCRTVLPGFQATYFGLYGKGNSTPSANLTVLAAPFLSQYFPDWIVNMGYLSYQHPWFMLTAQMFWSQGQSGRQLDHRTE